MESLALGKSSTSKQWLLMRNDSEDEASLYIQHVRTDATAEEEKRLRREGYTQRMQLHKICFQKQQQEPGQEICCVEQVSSSNEGPPPMVASSLYKQQS